MSRKWKWTFSVVSCDDFDFARQKEKTPEVRHNYAIIND